MKFSQRMGITPLTKLIQSEDIDMELRNSLWSTFKMYFLDKLNKRRSYSGECEFDFFLTVLWFTFYKLPIDKIPQDQSASEYIIRDTFYKYSWHQVYDFLEFIACLDTSILKFDHDNFVGWCNTMLERENSAFRFIDDKIAPITNPTEIKEIEEAIELSGQFTTLKGANTHLKNSLDKLSDKKNPDYRNSIKESISAVESVAKAISKGKADTLGAALDKIKGKTKIHPALEKGFKQLYGYTSDSDGIRHALMDKSTCEFEDAKFMLVSCSAFINYLIAKATKFNIEL